jgi:hypothetical protein
MNLRISIVLVLTGLLLIGCGGRDDARRHRPAGQETDYRKPLAWGHEQTIYVFADSNVWEYAEPYLRESIERYYFTTENETYFDLKRADFSAIQQFYRFKNLIFLAHLDSEQQVSSYVKERLSDNILQSVREEGVGMFTSHNLWANDQLVIFLLGDTEANLLRYNILQANEVFEQFRSKLFARIEKKVYGLNIHPEVMFRNLPWSMKIPENYVIYERDENNNFISYLARRREQPDRYLAVYSEEMEENRVNLDWLIETRARLVWNYYDEDEFQRNETRSEQTEISNQQTIKISGRWQNAKYAIGGAFQSFAFYDKANGRAYLIDNSVFYPEGFKLPALIELEVISRTLELKDMPVELANSE